MTVNTTGTNIAWSLAAASGPMEIQYVTVNELRSPKSMDPGKAGQLQRAGLTAQDYSTLLARDPFASGPTLIDPGGSGIDTSRFVPLNQTFPYDPDSADVQTYTLTNDLASKVTSQHTDDYQVGVSVEGTTDIILAKDTLKVADTMDWTNTSTHGTSSEDKQSASFSVAGPSRGYAGPVSVDVFYDTMYGTFLFGFDPASAPIGGGAPMAPTRSQQTVTGLVKHAGTGGPAAHQAITLSQGGKTFRTFTNGRGQFTFFHATPSSGGQIVVNGKGTAVQGGVMQLVVTP
jgi:hypothetical protein